MKFNLATLLLAVALVAVVIGWIVDRNAHQQEITELQAIHQRQLTARLQLERTQTFNEVARALSLNRTFEMIEHRVEFQLVSDFNLLCRNRHQLEPLATRRGLPVVDIAGETLFYLGWKFNNEQELIELLDSWLQQEGGIAPCPDDKEFRDFLKKVIAEKKRLESDWGDLYENGIQKWATQED